MKTINFPRIIGASLITYLIGIAAFISSYYLPFLENAELQANIVLTIFIIPASIIGARFYLANAKGPSFLIGAIMFALTIIWDASITVPLFIIPAGGNHLSFFSDPGFWFIGGLYVLSVGLYARIKAVA